MGIIDVLIKKGSDKVPNIYARLEEARYAI